MILTGKMIAEEHKLGRIVIEPYSYENVTTNSYDLRLGETVIAYTQDILDPNKKSSYKEIALPTDGFVLEKGSFHLGASFERVGSTHYVPMIHAKSGIARLGLFIHVTADLIDIGYIGNVTFQLFATESIRIFPKMLIAQMTFWKPIGNITLYDGKYQDGKGPQISKTYKDFV